MTVLAMASRFFITIAMNTGIQYTVELIPTQLRGQGTGVVHITGHGATFFSPFILYLVKTKKNKFISFPLRFFFFVEKEIGGWPGLPSHGV